MVKYVHDIQKKQHRERSQPQERKRLGHLQKKKDYKLRAKDYHDKQERLKILREKASNKNPDEYYHSMTSRKTDDKGILITERETSQSLNVDEVKLLKTQDVNYIKTKRASELKQAERMINDQTAGYSTMFESKGKHTVFVEDQSDFENFNLAKHFNTDERLVNRTSNRLTLEQLSGKKPSSSVDNPELLRKINEKKLKKLKLIKQKLQRAKQLEKIELKMNQQRELMKNGSKKKVIAKDGTISFRWKNQRKR